MSKQVHDDPELARILKKHVAVAKEAEEPPPLPPAGEHLWRWYGKISAPRNSNGFGITEVRWIDIEAWERRYGVQLENWEAEAIIAIDAEVRHALAQRAAKKPDKPNNPNAGGKT